MWTFGIDTSSPILSCALRSSSGEVLASNGNSPASHNEELLDVFRKLCAEAGVKPQDLEKIVVGAGPGSFTGLRISYAFAKGLCLSLKISLLTISSFAAAAVEHAAKETAVFVMSAAGRNEFFFGAYTGRQDGSVAPHGPEEIIGADDVPHRIAELCDVLEVKQSTAASPEPFRLPVNIREGLSVRSSIELAAGLCFLGQSPVPAFSMEELAKAAPNYIRRPAAKTIAERRAENTGK